MREGWVKLVGAAALLLLMSGFCSAAGVYKWVDKDGNTQFSSTPPPEAMAGAEQVGNTKSTARTRRGTSITGEWYTMLGNEARRLTIDYDGGFLYGRTGPGRGPYVDYAKGRYRHEEGEFELSYQDESGGPVKERYRVIDLTDTRLTLADERKKLTRYVREGRGDRSPERTIVSGSWIDADGQLYHFDSATVRIRSKSSAAAGVHANYWIRGKELTLEHLGTTANLRRIAEREQWEVLLLERAELRFKNAQGQVITLKRYIKR